MIKVGPGYITETSKDPSDLDQGLAKHPKNFDLAYNKARLQLEISQQAGLVEHIGHDLHEWLSIALESHQYALRLNDSNPDLLFNTSQVLTSLAESLEEADMTDKAVALYEQALEILSSCLARQEVMFEQHRADFPDNEDGGVPLEPESQASPSVPAADVEMQEQSEETEQSATVEAPVTALDMLDTVHASLSALIALVSVIPDTNLEALSKMARHLTQIKAPGYIELVPAEEQDQVRVTTAGLRATFNAALADSQYQSGLIDLPTYAESLNAFHLPNKESHIVILGSEAEARLELVHSAIDTISHALPVHLCWKQLSLAQDVLAKAAALTDDDAQARKAEIYQSKGDVELLRHRLIHWPATNQTDPPLTDAMRKAAPTLLQNAKKFYSGSVQFASRDGDEKAELSAKQRGALAQALAAQFYNETRPDGASLGIIEAQGGQFIDDYLVDGDLLQALLSGEAQAGRI
jgi:tetratricopeptide (TPR) repeat protein